MRKKPMEKFPTDRGSLYFGSNPTDEELEELKTFGITLVWNLGEELTIEVDLEREFAIVVHTAISDNSVPSDIESFISDMNIVCKHLDEGGKVFVHCLHGKGRTGTALACLEMVLNGRLSAEALILAKKYCNGPEKSNQIEFVKILEKYEKEKSNP